MKVTGIISIAILSLLLGTAALACAQQDQDKPAPQDEKAQKDKSAKQEDKNAKQQDKNNTTRREKSAQQQDNNRKQEEKNAQQQEQRAGKEQRAAAKQEEPTGGEKHTAGAARRGNGGGRIPEDRFRANFGREHSFRVSQGDYSRDRRFQYGGYSFVFVDEWPSNWLYTQDMFIVEIDGVYYLCNPMYPDVNITLEIAE